MNRSHFTMLAVAVAAGVATASPVQVQVTGEVDYAVVRQGPLSAVHSGDAVTMTFLVDSSSYVDSMNYPVRGYTIDTSSFSLTMGSVTIGFQNPYPAGDTPMFAIRNNDPAVDGFYMTSSVTNLDWPIDQPLSEDGFFGPFGNAFATSYDGSMLSSLDIMGALGTYDYTGMGSFNWGVDDDSFMPIGFIFEQMTISSVPAPSTMIVGAAPLALLARRRRN